MHIPLSTTSFHTNSSLHLISTFQISFISDSATIQVIEKPKFRNSTKKTTRNKQTLRSYCKSTKNYTRNNRTMHKLLNRWRQQQTLVYSVGERVIQMRRMMACVTVPSRNVKLLKSGVMPIAFIFERGSGRAFETKSVAVGALGPTEFPRNAGVWSVWSRGDGETRASLFRMIVWRLENGVFFLGDDYGGALALRSIVAGRWVEVVQPFMHA